MHVTQLLYSRMKATYLAGEYMQKHSGRNTVQSTLHLHTMPRHGVHSLPLLARR